MAGEAGRRRRASGLPRKAMIKFVYKLVSLLVSVLGGILAGAIFKQVRKLAAREEEPPTATDDRHRAGGSGPGRCPQARASAERLNR